MEDNEHSVNLFSSVVTDNGNSPYGHAESVAAGWLQAESGISTAVQQHGESQDSVNGRQQGMDNYNANKS
ncbi:hypothetical protein [Humidesulfovibrio sp.]